MNITSRYIALCAGALILSASLKLGAEPLSQDPPACEQHCLIANKNLVGQESFRRGEPVFFVYEADEGLMSSSYRQTHSDLTDFELANFSFEHTNSFEEPFTCLHGADMENPPQHCDESLTQKGNPWEYEMLPMLKDNNKQVKLHSFDWLQITRKAGNEELVTMHWGRDAEVVSSSKGTPHEVQMPEEMPYIWTDRRMFYFPVADSFDGYVSLGCGSIWPTNTGSGKTAQMDGRVSIAGIRDKVLKAFPGVDEGIVWNGLERDDLGRVKTQGGSFSDTTNWTFSAWIDDVWLYYKFHIDARS